MVTHPYSAGSQLADLLWEAKMVADAYSSGGLILIRTGEGWRAFLGRFKDEFGQEIEESLDRIVPSYGQAFGEIERSQDLISEIKRLLPNCMVFEGYRPMKFVDDAMGLD